MAEASLLRAAIEGRTAVVHRLLREHGPRRVQSESVRASAHGEHWVEFDADDPRRQHRVGRGHSPASRDGAAASMSKTEESYYSESNASSSSSGSLTVAVIGRVLLGLCKSQPTTPASTGAPRVDIVVAMCRHAQGVLPAAVTKRGTTALMAAALQGHAAVCMALIEEGADVDARNDQDQTALSFAATRGHHKVVFALLDRRRTIAANTSHKMNINDLPDTNGRTPLIHAATGGHLQCCELLLSMARARTNATDSHGRTPLILAATQGHKALCKLLVEDYGADVNQASTHGITPLMAAIDASQADCAFLLLDQLKADIRRRNSQGACALTYACKRGLVGVCVSLVQMGLEVDSANDRGTTALMVAANNGHVDICRFLLDQGADLDAVNADYATPIDCASSPEVNTLFVKWLQEHNYGRIPSENVRGQGTREEQAKQQRQREREQHWTTARSRDIANNFGEGKRESDRNTHRLEEESIDAESKDRTGHEDERRDVSLNESKSQNLAERNIHRKRTLRAINEQHAMITHSFLGQKVDEEDIERVNTILAERMARFYDLCERDDGSGEVFLGEDAENEDDWRFLLEQHRPEGTSHHNDTRQNEDEPSGPPPAPPHSHEEYQPNEDREITDLHYRTITLEEEREDRRRNRRERDRLKARVGEEARLRTQIRQQSHGPLVSTKGPTEGEPDSGESEEDDEIHAFNCPITQDRMTDPVTCMDGHTYERKGIERWLEDHDTSPLTGVKLPSKMLIPNHSLRHAIEEYDKANARNRGKK